MTTRADPTQAQKGEAFASLLAGGSCVLPNPWAHEPARIHEGLGAVALAGDE